MCGEESDEWVGTECELVRDNVHQRISGKEDMWWGFLYLNHQLCHNVIYRATAHHVDAAQHGNHGNTKSIFYYMHN